MIGIMNESPLMRSYGVIYGSYAKESQLIPNNILISNKCFV